MSYSGDHSRSLLRMRYIGSSENVEGLMSYNDDLSSKVVEHCNESQELMMLNHFLKESSEYQFQQCVQERMSTIASWKWVLEDLSNRLEEAIKALKYEHNALRVIVERVDKEIEEHCREGSRPGALCPLTDAVEHAVMQEYKFLCAQKKKFEGMIESLFKSTASIEKTRRKIDSDIVNKNVALETEERCSAINLNSLSNSERRRKKTRAVPPQEWERHCNALKTAGLRSLANGVIIRQQIRGERAQLSAAAQAHAARVDAVLRKRLHANQAQLDEMRWQREEAVRDLQSLEEEQRSTEECFMVNVDQIRLVQARIDERTQKPVKELIRDKLDSSLKAELTRLRQFSRVLTENLDKISGLQKTLLATITRFDCSATDLAEVITLDSERIHARQGCECPPGNAAARGDQAGHTASSEAGTTPAQAPCFSGLLRPANTSLHTIMEENEDDEYDSVADYPVDF